MDIEDLEPRKKLIPPVNLDVMSVEELNDYVQLPGGRNCPHQGKDRGEKSPSGRCRFTIQII